MKWSEKDISTFFRMRYSGAELDEIKKALNCTKTISGNGEKRMENTRTLWTPELEEKLTSLYDEGKTWKEIGLALNCTVTAAQSRYHKKIKPQLTDASVTAAPAPIPKPVPERIHTPEPKPETLSANPDEPTKMLELYSQIIQLAATAGFVPNHAFTDFGDDVMCASASGNVSDGWCVALTLTRYKPEPDVQG